MDITFSDEQRLLRESADRFVGETYTADHRRKTAAEPSGFSPAIWKQFAELGWLMLPFLLVHNLVAWWQLTSANYVEHYGLLRERLPSGRYEAPAPHHSWNANHLVTNLALFHLQRHSDHHAYPSRRYQSLRHFEDLPQLPSGYFGMFPLAYVPALWFRVMDKRLLALPHVRGDLGRINICPRARPRIVAAYGAG